jgi:hypothetical protein
LSKLNKNSQFSVSVSAGGKAKENKQPPERHVPVKDTGLDDTVVISDSDDEDDGYVAPAVVRPPLRRPGDRGGRVGYDGFGGREPVENPRDPDFPTRRVQSFKRPRVAASTSSRPKSKTRDGGKPLVTLDNMWSLPA